MHAGQAQVGDQALLDGRVEHLICNQVCKWQHTLSCQQKLNTQFSRRVFFLVSRKSGPRWKVVLEGLGHHVDVVMVGGDGLKNSPP